MQVIKLFSKGLHYLVCLSNPVSGKHVTCVSLILIVSHVLHVFTSIVLGHQRGLNELYLVSYSAYKQNLGLYGDS